MIVSNARGEHHKWKPKIEFKRVSLSSLDFTQLTCVINACSFVFSTEEILASGGDGKSDVWNE